MAEKRVQGQRVLKQFMVRYGVDKTDKIALTTNLSEAGINLNTSNVFKPGVSVQVELKFPDRTFNMWARVVWVKKVPRQQAHLLKGCMGLCFFARSPEWPEYFGAWSKRQPGSAERERSQA